MPVKLNGATSGSVTIDAPAVAGTTTLTLPSTSGTFNISGAVNEVPAGSVSAPSIYSTGDTNTGIFFPAADTIAFTEGGAEAMRINSSGNVGIGTTTPGAILHTTKTSAGAATVGAFLQNSSDTASTEVRLAFASNTALLSSDRYGWIGHINTGGTNGGALTFATTPGGEAATERMRIDSSGNVVIGTTDNSLFNSVGGTTRLAVCGSSASTDILGNTGASISIINTDTTANNTAGLHFARADTDDTPNYAGASIVAQFPDTQVTGQYPKGLLAFLTSTTANSAPSEKMRISPDGFVFINQTAQKGNTIQRVGIQFAANVEWGLNITNSTTTTGNAINFTNSSGTQIGQIQNSTSATSYVTSSDYRLKENVAPITTGLTTISALKPVSYDWIGDKSHGEGFIAHELQELVPLAVTGQKDAVDSNGNPVHQGIDYSKIVVHLVAAIQEQQAMITALTARITALEVTP